MSRIEDLEHGQDGWKPERDDPGSVFQVSLIRENAEQERRKEHRLRFADL